jgi:cystathionine beta-synthase
MRENGFLESEWTEATLREVLGSKSFSELIAASADDRITDVVAKMKEYGISQLPAMNGSGEVTGLVREGDLLTFLLESKSERPGEQPIRPLLQQAPPSLPAHTPLGDAMPELIKHNAVLVNDGGRVVGILTKIDVLDFIQR